MKRIFSLALAVLLVCPVLFAQQGKRFQVAGVAFYNLENLFDANAGGMEKSIGERLKIWPMP